ncbi:mycofactocin-coupled SDR family oxidoreductase [Blastococcus sp. SYSU D00695]
MGLLDGKVVLITGGARGQGRAHALLSAQEGADVVVVDIGTDIATVPYGLGQESDLQETVRLVEQLDRRALAVVADVRSQTALEEAVQRAIAEFGKVDALIANAGILSVGPVWELTDEQWQDMIDVNLTGVWRSVKAVLPHMIEQGSGSIVLTSSQNGEEPEEGVGHYTAAKHGVLGLMKSVAQEAARHGIRCNAVKPGFVNSPMTTWPGMLDRYAGQEGAGTVEHAVQAGYQYNALPRPAMAPEAIARAALFLNSELAADVTGVALDVDGGHRVLPHMNLEVLFAG